MSQIFEPTVLVNIAFFLFLITGFVSIRVKKEQRAKTFLTMLCMMPLSWYVVLNYSHLVFFSAINALDVAMSYFMWIFPAGSTIYVAVEIIAALVHYFQMENEEKHDSSEG